MARTTFDDGSSGFTLHGAAAGVPEARATVERIGVLTLADFDASGLEIETLALIEAGPIVDDTLYAVPPRGTVGDLLDGTLSIDSGQVPITRIRRRSGTLLVINDNEPLSLATYFGTGGAGADLTLYVQTREGVASLPATTQGQAGGSFIQFGPIDTALDAVLDGIDDGTRFIFALARQLPVLALHGSAQAGAAEARARVGVVPIRTVRGTAEAGRPQARARLSIQSTGALYARSLRDSAPERRLLTALEIHHPAVAAPVRVINDTEDRTIEGNRYIALRFDASLADDVEGKAPQAELSIDNVGRELTQWIEAAQGGVGATVRVMQVLDLPDPPVEWELTMDVAGMQLDAERVTARLGFDPLLGRAAVTLRHDPQTSPGLF